MVRGSVHAEGDILWHEDIAGGEDGGALDDVFEFAHVAGPVVGLEENEGALGELERAAGALFGNPAEEELGERADVLDAFAERRDVDADDVEAVEQVLAEGAGFDGAFGLAVGGGDDADVGAQGLVAADAGELAFLEDAEELGLDEHGHFADFVEEEGAAVALFEAADALLHGTGERAFLVAEEFGFEQAFGDGGAVDGDEIFGGAVGELVDGAGDDFLAAAGFAGDEDGGVGAGDAADELEDVLHGGRLADHGFAGGVGLGGGARGGGFLGAQGLVGLEGGLDDRAEFVGEGGFAEEIVAADLHGLDEDGSRRAAGSQDDEGVRVLEAEFLEQVEAGEGLGEQLGDDEGWPVLFEPGEGGIGRLDAFDGDVAGGEVAFGPGEELFLRVDDENFMDGAVGLGHGLTVEWEGNRAPSARECMGNMRRIFSFAMRARAGDRAGRRGWPGLWSRSHSMLQISSHDPQRPPGPVYVIGHKNPDTDAICSAIGQAELLRRTGMETAVAACCGGMNPRTRWVLEQAGVEPPLLVMDVRPTAAGICRREVVLAREDETFLEVYHRMKEADVRSIPVVDGAGRVIGVPTAQDLMELLMHSTDARASAPDEARRLRTSLRNAARTLEAEVVCGRELESEQDFILTVSASSESLMAERLHRYPHDQLMVIVGDRPMVHELAVEHGVRALVLTSNVLPWRSWCGGRRPRG